MAAPDATAAALLASPVRREILDTLRTRQAGNPGALDAHGLTAAQVGKAVGLHTTTARFHLDQLVAAGILQASFHKHTGAGRPRKLYGVSDDHASTSVSDATALMLLTSLLTETFKASRTQGRTVTPDEAGERWAHENVPARDAEPAASPGEWLGKVGSLIDVLRRWGYTPDLSTSNGGRTARIDLTHCPFRELAADNTEIVCGIHRGLISGTMEQLGEPDTDVTLRPFADGNTCIAHLNRTAPFTASPASAPVRSAPPRKENWDD